jgi:hypothetical protein
MSNPELRATNFMSRLSRMSRASRATVCGAGELFSILLEDHNQLQQESV